MSLHPLLEKIEHYNSRLIPLCIVLLLAIIITEIFIHPEDPAIKLSVKLADVLVITIFIIDLVFLFIRSNQQGHTLKHFIRKYWIDIFAVLPFGLIAEGISRSAITITTAERVTVGQGIVHESLELSKVAGESERAAKIAREVKIGGRIFRIISKEGRIERFKRKIARYI